jgi:hypothetical protein
VDEWDIVFVGLHLSWSINGGDWPLPKNVDLAKMEVMAPTGCVDHSPTVLRHLLELIVPVVKVKSLSFIFVCLLAHQRRTWVLMKRLGIKKAARVIGQNAIEQP